MEIYKDNPSDNVVALIGNLENKVLFNKIIKSCINKFKYKIGKFKIDVGKYNYDDEDFLLVNFLKTKFSSNNLKNNVLKDFLLFYNPILTVVVINKKKLYDDLNMLVQVLELTNNVILCVLDIDKSKDDNINFDFLEAELNIPILLTNKINDNYVNKLIRKIQENCEEHEYNYLKNIYDSNFEDSINAVSNYIKPLFKNINTRALSIQLLTNNNINKSINKYLSYDISMDLELLNILKKEKEKNIYNSLIIQSNKLYIKSISVDIIK